MKTAFIFAGQGAQYTGMGKDLYDEFPSARDVFDEAGHDIKNWCFDGSEEELRQTHITQPCVYTMTIAALAAFCSEAGVDLSGRFLEDATEAGKTVVCGLAGFSLGEYAALTASGSIAGIKTTVEILRKRGQYMAEAGRYPDGSPRGGMCAVIGERERVLSLIDEIRGDDVIEAVNFNTQTQTVAAGDINALKRLRDKGREVRLKVIPLNVSTAFHSRMMEPAAVRLKEVLAEVSIYPPLVKVYSNITGRDIMEGAPFVDGREATEKTWSIELTDGSKLSELKRTRKDEMADGGEQPETVTSEWLRNRLALQVMHPVYWQETIENMVSDGVDLFIEFGPGRILSGFVKKIAPSTNTCNVENLETLKTSLEMFRG